ncbi:MAG: glycosyltransferase family 39 protein [Acidobacteriia bacterium]|nr:glycosyltransferase family 39 protein [Terriglobia bacterium]
MFYLHHLFRSLQPVHNPIGFGAVDFIEFFLAAVLVLLVLAWPRLQPVSSRLASRTAVSMAVLFLLPIVLRIALLRVHPIPEPYVADDFGYTLLADTLSHFRLTNPPHPMHRFFETFFVLQEPTYSSIYPPGPALAMAAGRALFGHFWAGIALAIGALCASCYWMLRAWTTPGWALAGGLLAVLEFGPLSQWMNSFWGGAVSATAGCLVFGALPRLRDRHRIRDAIILGAGLGLQLITRPFESLFLLAAAIIFLIPDFRRAIRLAPVIALAALPALALTLLHDKRVTGEWTTLPYALSRYQYGVPSTFTFQSGVSPHRELTREQRLDYEAQASVHGENTDSLARYAGRLASRARFYRFFFLTPLYLALLAFPFALKNRKYRWLLLPLALFILGGNFYAYFFTHYVAAITCVLVLIGILGLQKLPPIAAQWIYFACIAQFALWYAAHLTGDPAMWQFETWDAINYGDPEGRLAVNRELAAVPGKQLVFVRYGPRHTFKEWVFNDADIDHSRVVWARDLGPDEDEKLRAYYPNRTAWLLEPDLRPVHLKPYAAPPPAAPEKPPPNPKLPHLKFEEVH